MRNPDDFLPLEAVTVADDDMLITRPGPWQRLAANKLAVLGLIIVVFMILAAVFGPMLSPYTYAQQNLTEANQAPSAAHWFGTDTLGRDLCTRVLYGARISLAVGFVAAAMAIISDSADPKKLGGTLGMAQTSLVVGGICGPLMVGALSHVVEEKGGVDE